MKKAVLRAREQEYLDLDIVIFHKDIYEVGGIESWLYYIAKKYNVGQITVLYGWSHPNQIKRLSPYINLVQYKGQPIRCNKIIFTMTINILKELYDSAKERYITIHCNYNDKFDYGYAKLPLMDKIYAVSDTAKECFEKIQEEKVFTLLNPVEIDKPKKLLRLISATRLTQEKRIR